MAQNSKSRGTSGNIFRIYPLPGGLSAECLLAAVALPSPLLLILTVRIKAASSGAEKKERKRNWFVRHYDFFREGD